MASAASEILRFATAGSVDDGKSSLIGRLLYDSKSIFEDQLLSVEETSRRRGSSQIELALLTDGLRAEREQNITIDVAYRYFATDKRKFIIADTPGHLQYTRNMVTGASTADLSIILVDARKGVLSQSRRHAAISSLLGIKHLVLAVNKMDLVGFDQSRFEAIVEEFRSVASLLGVDSVTAIPISALLGDNVVDRSENTPWYHGPTLLQFLESVEVGARSSSAFRLPVQYVIRPNQDYRGFAGQIESGSLSVGDTVAVASTSLSAVVTEIRVNGLVADRAESGQAVSVRLDREIEISRGDLLYDPASPPTVSDRFEALACWMGDEPLVVGRRYVLLHGRSRVPAVVERVEYRLDVDTLGHHDGSLLGMNDIGGVMVRTARPIPFDPYSSIASTGSFVLVDPGSNVTVAGGMIQGLSSGVAPDVSALGHATVTLAPADLASVESMLAALAREGIDVVRA